MIRLKIMILECGIMGKEIALRMARAKAARGKAKK